MEKYHNKLFGALNNFADIAAILKPPETKNSPQNNSKKYIYQTTGVLGIEYNIASQIPPEKSYYRSYWERNIGKWFAEELYNIALLYADVSIISFICIQNFQHLIMSFFFFIDAH